MTQYQYDDTFIINSVTDQELEDAETKALTNLGKQGVVDTYYLEQMCIPLVYIDLAGQQLEAPEMMEKIDYYRKQYNYYSNANQQTGADNTVMSAEIGRG